MFLKRRAHGFFFCLAQLNTAERQQLAQIVMQICGKSLTLTLFSQIQFGC